MKTINTRISDERFSTTMGIDEMYITVYISVVIWKFIQSENEASEASAL